MDPRIATLHRQARFRWILVVLVPIIAISLIWWGITLAKARYAAQRAAGLYWQQGDCFAVPGDDTFYKVRDVERARWHYYVSVWRWDSRKEVKRDSLPIGIVNARMKAMPCPAWTE